MFYYNFKYNNFLLVTLEQQFLCFLLVFTLTKQLHNNRLIYSTGRACGGQALLYSQIMLVKKSPNSDLWWIHYSLQENTLFEYHTHYKFVSIFAVHMNTLNEFSYFFKWGCAILITILTQVQLAPILALVNFTVWVYNLTCN